MEKNYVDYVKRYQDLNKTFNPKSLILNIGQILQIKQE